MNRGLGLCRPLPYRLAMVPHNILYASGGNNRTRTYDPLLVRQMLSQLSYAPAVLIYNIKYERKNQPFFGDLLKNL